MLGAVRDTLGLLNKSLKLERADGKVRVVFEHTAPAPAEQAALPPRSMLDRMRADLDELLGRCRGARDVLQHLACLEQGLRSKGIGAFDVLPPRVLKRAAAQLESIVTEPVSEGIGELRSRILVALTVHEETEIAASRRAGPSSFLVDEKLQVSEASVSDFMRVVEESNRGS
jgi:hypothetical protein